MRLILKILAAPLVVALTLFVWICTILLYCTGMVLGLAALVVALLGVAVLVTYSLQNGIILLVIAFLISDGTADCGGLAAWKGPEPTVCNPGPHLQVNAPPGYGIIGTWKGGGGMGASNKVCPVCGRKMKQQFIGLQHCKCGMSWKKDIGFFERTSDMVFALERRTVGKKVKQVPVIRRKD